MFIRSYRSAFILLFLALLVLTVLGVSTNAYRRATRVSLDLSADIIAEMSEKVVARTLSIFEQARGFLETDALVLSMLHHGNDAHLATGREALFRLFAKQLELVPQVQSLYVADPNGNFVQLYSAPNLVTRVIERTAADGTQLAEPLERLIYRDGDFTPIAHITGVGEYDPRQRPWYAGAEHETLYISEVYRFASDHRPGVTLVRAVRDADGGLRYVLGADVALNSISGLLASQRLAKGGVALIVDAAGGLVAFPYWLQLEDGTEDAADAGHLPRVEDLTARWLVSAYRGSRTGTARVSGNAQVEYTLTETKGARYIAHRKPFPDWLGADWALFVVVPEASLLSGAARLFSESAVISLIMLVVAAFAVSWFALRLFEPLTRLVANTEHVRALRFDQVQRVGSRFKEIHTMDSAIWRMKHALASLIKFVPARVAGQLVESGQALRPEAEVRQLAVLLTGISALGALCERLPPARITALLSAELEAFTRAILRRKGTLDNYLGDSILAFWGAPVDCEDGAGRACQAALDCLKLEQQMFADWDEPDVPPPENLFSVHAGPCIVGALGSDLHMSWTAIGDNIARGWHLRRMNRRYGTRIMVSGEARKQAGEAFWFRQLDVLPAGHPEAGSRELALFELVEHREHPLAAGHAERIDAYERALAALLAQDWAAAERGFSRLAKRWPEDAATRLMLERCRRRDSCWCPAALPRIGSVGAPAGNPTMGPLRTTTDAGAAD
jgi:adenylate cyclase